MRISEYKKRGGIQSAWLVEPIIGFTHNALTVGSKGSAKSLIAWFIARAVASGKPLMGFPAMKMPVLIIDEETPENDFQTRIDGIFGDEDLDIDTFPRPEGHGFNFGDKEWVKKLKDKLRSLNTSRVLLIIDNLNATQGSLRVEESNVDVGELRKVFRELRGIVPELTIILIAHTGKDETRGTRGASAIEDMSDTILRLKRVWDNPFRFAVEQVPRKRPAYIKPFIVELDAQRKQWELIYLGEEENIQLPEDDDKVIFEHFRKVIGDNARTVNEIDSNLEGRISVRDIRDSLNRLGRQGVLQVGTEAHNLHRYSLVNPLPRTHFVSALTGILDPTQKNNNTGKTGETKQAGQSTKSSESGIGSQIVQNCRIIEGAGVAPMAVAKSIGRNAEATEILHLKIHVDRASFLSGGSNRRTLN
jgi:hypothetical protein